MFLLCRIMQLIKKGENNDIIMINNIITNVKKNIKRDMLINILRPDIYTIDCHRSRELLSLVVYHYNTNPQKTSNNITSDELKNILKNIKIVSLNNTDILLRLAFIFNISIKELATIMAIDIPNRCTK